MTDIAQQSPAEDSIAVKDLGLILVMNVAWGSNFVVSKFAVTELPPIFSAAVRFLIVAVLCLPWLKPLYGRMRAVLTIGLLMGFLHFALLFMALRMSEKVSGLAIIAQLGVPISVIMAVVLLGERVGVKRLSGITLAFVGAIVLGFDPVIFDDLDAVSVMLVSVIIMSYCAILMRKLTGVSPLELQAWIGLSSFLPLFALSAGVEWKEYASIPEAAWTGWLAVFYTASVSSIVAHAINFYLIQRYPISAVAPYSLLAPVIGVLTSVWFLGDAITWQLLIGGVITLAGVLIITMRGAATKA